MPLPYNQNKTHNSKWRESNKNKYNEYQRAYMQKKRLMEQARMELFAILRD